MPDLVTRLCQRASELRGDRGGTSLLLEEAASALRAAKAEALEEAATFVEEHRQGGDMDHVVQVFDVLGKGLRARAAALKGT